MHKISTATLLSATALILLSGCGYIPFSGDQLEGTWATPPDDWTEIARAEIVQLETRPNDPYSVKLWVIGMGAKLYVHAGANRATWVEHIEVNPNVRLLVESSLYSLRAERVVDPEEFRAFSDAYESKYARRPQNENVAEVYLYQLSSQDQ